MFFVYDLEQERWIVSKQEIQHGYNLSLEDFYKDPITEIAALMEEDWFDGQAFCDFIYENKEIEDLV